MGLIDRTGEVYSGLRIVEELGGNEVKAQCKKCGHIDTYNKSGLVSESIKNCKKCKESSELKVGDVNGDFTVAAISNDKERLIVTCNNCNKQYKRAYKSFKYSEEPKCKICSENSNFKNVKGQVFGKLKVITDTGGGVVRARCEDCGAIGDYNKGRLTSQGLQCICCDKKNSPLYQNQVNKVFNGLMVLDEEVSQDGKYIAVVECVDCGHKSKVSKGSLVTLGHACKECFDKDKTGLCPNCKATLVFRRDGAKCRCSKCKQIFSREIISAPIDFAYRLYKNEQKYGTKGSRVVGSMQLLGYKYTGRDELLYFEAVCLDHNAKVVSSMNEAKVGSHEVCDCEFDM